MSVNQQRKLSTKWQRVVLSCAISALRLTDINQLRYLLI